MILVNESNNHKILYRYDNHLYNPGDIIQGIPTKVRNINEIALRVYTRYCKFDFEHGYTYMVNKRQDNNFKGSLYLYVVKPIGQTFTGHDEHSLDKCNDYIKGMIKSSMPSEKHIHSIAMKYVDEYMHNPEEMQSVISQSCKVLKRIKLPVNT